MPKRIAIMQPYVFPYLGYFQLVSAVDLFVFYNDVNFIKKGWIHRNRILLNGKDFMITIPCVNVSQNKLICETELALDNKEKKRILTTISQAYRKAPYFEEVFFLIDNIFKRDYKTIDELAIRSVEAVSGFLNIPTTFRVSGGIYGNSELKREDRLIDICLKENVLQYINPQGGVEIYSKDYFRKKNVDLNFLVAHLEPYVQFGNDFVSGLSIIDVLMFNKRETICDVMLKSYALC